MQTETSKSILLVEDMAIIAMAEATTLKKNGFNVIIAYNGNEAIKLASENPTLDLILMDIDLGKGMDGTEAAQLILKTHEIPIVFLSNHTEKEIVEKTEKITSYGYVVKNSGETVLLASIKMAFKLFEAHQLRFESEKKLLESDKKFHILEKQIDDVIWTMDMNFRLIYISPSVEKMHGYTVDEMMKLNLQDYLTEESAQKAIDVLGEEISSYLKDKIEKNIVTIEIDQRKKDGTIFPTEIRARFLLDEQGLPSGMIGVSRDISQRYQAEKALRDSEKTLNLALEGAQIGFWDSNYQTGRVYRSDIWASMLGYTIAEVDNTPEFWQKHIHPDDYERVMTEVNKHEAGKVDSFSVEHRMRTKSGKYKWILDWGKVFERTESGKPIRAMGLHIDIDDRIKTQQRLLETNRTLTLAIEGARIGLWSQNFETGEVIRSEYWASMLGYEINEIENKLGFWKSLIHPDDYEMTIKTAEEHEQGKTEFYKVQHRLKCKDGSYKWILNWGKISERDESGKPVRALGIHLDIDENKQIEESLKLSEERLRYALEGNSDGIWDWNLKTGVVYFSPHYYTMLGYQPNEFLPSYDKWKELMHPDDFVESEAAVFSAIEKLTPFSIEFRLRKKDGTYCWILARGKVAEKDSDGKALRISGSHTDINERKLSEEALKKNENKLNSIFKAAPVGIGMTSNRVLLEVNDTMCKMLGYNCNELIGNSALMLYPTKEEYEFVGNEKYEQIKKSGTGTVETKWKKKDGKVIDVLLSSTPLNLNDISGGVTFVALDITERKKTEFALKESQQMLQNVLDKFPGVVFWKDRDSRYIGCNMTFAKGAGLTKPEEIVGKTDFDLPWADTEAQNYVDDDRRVMESAIQKLNIEETQHQADGSIKWFNTNKVPLVDSSGNIIGVLGTSNDITSRKIAEHALLENERKIRSIFKVAPIGIGVTENRVLIELNEYVCNLLGYKKEELIGKSAEILYPTMEEFEYVGKEKYQQIEERGIGTIETKWVHKNGKIIDVLLSSTPLNLKDLSSGVTFTALDITNRKRDESLIKESEANLIAVINHREEAIWSIDKEYNYIIVNDVFKTDYKHAFNIELKKGINALDILSEELLEFWKLKYDKALSGEVVKFEFVQKIQNQTISFEMTLSPIISDSKVIGVSGISRDITKRKEMDEEIIQRKEDLERFEKIVIGRELKMIELKEKLKEMEQRLKEYQKNA